MPNNGKPELSAAQSRLLQEPLLTLVPDSAIPTNDLDADNFDLSLRMGPVYEIVRHPETETPLSVAIYGGWGTGKTSAMKWLEGRLDEWNDGKPNKDSKKRPTIKLNTAWFYPWKYQSREDVWRGLIAEVIVACLDHSDLDATKLLAETKDLVQFLGKSLFSVLTAAKIKYGVGEFSVPKELADIAEEYIAPQSAYLNEFETVFQAWVEKSLGKNERLVVFIDDLDRCQPQIALQVLEALKLYLNIKNLIFVVGVDNTVVNELVIKHYDELGVDKKKALQYLAKMFQVEVPVAPSEPQMAEFLDNIVTDNSAWKELSETAQYVFRKVIGNLAERSPREIKRLVNSSLMAGAGARMSSLADDADSIPPTAEQGMQVFLVHWILERRHQRGSLVGRKTGTDLFKTWSEFARAYEALNAWIELSNEDIEFIRGYGSERGTADEDEASNAPDVAPSLAERLGANVAVQFIPFVVQPRIKPFLELLADRDLAALMAIEYPEEAAAISGGPGIADASAIVWEAVARAVRKPVDDLTDEHFRTVTSLDLDGTDLTDLAPLQDLTALQRLQLHNTSVTDLTPLRGLTNLRRLTLINTRVSKIYALHGLTEMRELYLNGTQVGDIAPLDDMRAHEYLELSHTPVEDLRPLQGASTALQWLNIAGTQVIDISPLQKMTALQELHLPDTSG